MGNKMEITTALATLKTAIGITRNLISVSKDHAIKEETSKLLTVNGTPSSW